MGIKKTQPLKTTIFLFFTLLAAIVIAANIGTANIYPLDIIKIVLSKIPGINISLEGISNSSNVIIWEVRLPRVLLATLVGASLGITGGAFQGLLKNPMADPFILGVSSGAALGAAITIILGISFTVFGLSAITIAAFIGALIAVTLVYNIGKVKNQVPVNTLLLSGIAIGQFLTSIMSFLMVIYSKDMAKIIYWTMGSLSGKGWTPIVSVGGFLLVAMLLLQLFSNDLNLMLAGEEAAKSMGVDVERTKVYVLVLGTFITALAVSVSGIIGFVGLIIPHTARIIFGPNHKTLLPASALCSAIFMIFADTIARTAISPTEIPVGIITAMFGGPFFVYLLKKKKEYI